MLVTRIGLEIVGCGSQVLDWPQQFYLNAASSLSSSAGFCPIGIAATLELETLSAKTISH
jgi:hypothetical protein